MTHHFPAVGIIGASGFKEDWLGLLERFSVVCVLDSDPAGDAAAKRYQALFAARGQQFARIRLPLDINDYFKARPTAAIELALIAEAASEGSQRGWHYHGREKCESNVKQLPVRYNDLEISHRRQF
jgi:DNA primase